MMLSEGDAMKKSSKKLPQVIVYFDERDTAFLNQLRKDADRFNVSMSWLVFRAAHGGYKKVVKALEQLNGGPSAKPK